MAPRNRTYRLSREAMADIEAIYAYTVERWSIRQADAYYADLIAAFEGLAEGVKLGVRSEIIPAYFRLSVGSHLIFYRHTEEQVDIVRILHRAMDVERHLKP